jgi:hypothetical protein
VLENYAEIVVAVKEQQEITREFYERQFAVIGEQTPAQEAAPV